MALAVLRFGDVDGANARFDVDVGDNAWFLYAIGDGTTEDVRGIEVLAAPRHTSALAGPVPPQKLGRVTLDVPLSLFDRENRHMQLMSFRTEERDGPAVSDIVRVPVGGWRRSAAQGIPLGGRLGAPRPRARPRAGRTIPFTLVEAQSRPEYSTAMFWQALIGLLPQIIPAVAPIVSNLLGGLFGGGGGGGGANANGGANAGGGGIFGQIADLLKKPETKGLIDQILKAVTSDQKQEAGGGGGGTNTPNPTGENPLGGAKSLITLPGARGIGGSRIALAHARLVMPRAQSLAYGAGGRSRAMFVDGGVLTGPALAGLVSTALPALMPLLQKFATPEMLNTLFANTSPEKTLGGVVDILMDPNRKQFERLWKNTPEIAPSVLPVMLVQMGGSASPIPSYRRVDAVTLSLDGLVQVAVHGVPRVAYRAGRDIAVSITVQTPRPISNAELHWQVKRLETRETVAHDVVALGRVEAGALEPLVISASALSALEVPADYTLCVHLVWKTTKGERIGTRRSVVATLAGEYQFDRVERATGPDGTASEPIALGDAQLHRDFWHKVWEGRFTEQDRKRRVELRYYYTLGDGPDVARMETATRRTRTERGDRVLRLKTGLSVGLDALVRLADVLQEAQPTDEYSPDATPTLADTVPLDADRIAALRSSDFRARVAQAATANLELRGRAGERAALWVYPEVTMQRVILKRASTVDDAGQITAYEETPVLLPLPALAHFIGTRTDR